MYLGIALTLALATWPLASRGACSVNNTAGDDISNCDSATAPGFTDTGGNNTLTLTATGRIAGNVSYGDGNDRVNVNGPNAASMATSTRATATISFGWTWAASRGRCIRATAKT
ncbi:hypothetical protein [Pseudomonas sp. S3_A03]